ncbi:MAG: hypothetical protein HOE69_03255 [Euryarchaeota archaeon]|jgi:hypothetical protein|nr:hypothetical protein [Euryarchaeota archaeon]
MNDKSESVAIMLPRLSKEHLEMSATEESIAWVWGLLGNHRPGDIFAKHVPGDGVMLQKVTFDTVRCIRVFNHPVPMYELSMLKSLFDNAKATLEIGSCTVVTPVPKDVLEESENNIKQTTSSEIKMSETTPASKEATKKSGYNYGMEVA